MPSRKKDSRPLTADDHYRDTKTIGAGSVYIEKGVTKNMGDFNSARVTVAMTLPINYTPEELEEAKKTLKIVDEIVTDELESQVAAILGESDEDGEEEDETPRKKRRV